MVLSLPDTIPSLCEFSQSLATGKQLGIVLEGGTTVFGQVTRMELKAGRVVGFDIDNTLAFGSNTFAT